MAEYTTFRRHKCCVCLAEWLPVLEREAVRRGILKRNIDIAQLTGTSVGASAGTHAKGGVFDLWNYSPAFIRLCRDMGADATWHRRRSQGPWSPHAHGVLTGCPHNSPARYQIDEVRNNQNGLVGNARDDGPRPLSGRTWKQGIEWAKAQGGPVPTPPTPTVTVFDHAHWNVASPKPGWFKYSWDSRKERIGQTLKDLSCSIVTTNETHYSYQTADILRHLGDHYRHVSSPIGNDLFFDDTKYDQTRPYVEYDLGAQARKAGVLHLNRVQTGRALTIVNTHFPYGSASLRAVAARSLVKLLATVDGPIVLAGDFNNESFASGTPHYYLRRAGYDFMREQATITNGSKPEYPAQGRWLCDIATRQAGPAEITGGALTLTSSTLSDHRPIKARVEIR